ncbi:hypothetical protein J3R30DRAFT_1830035 [Lentinula aciculospora]|uniref:Tetraspanin Tsp2 family n=1 Tax=Lentinula aciculospora TaxID=153920 RepID=A0A9W9DS84_9AGAR|nr:hypothetical protein J3R30DRAFT_1830035 [Lentinula aciculospora]
MLTGESLDRPKPPFSSSSALLTWPPRSLGDASNSALSVNYIPSKFSAALLSPKRPRRRKRRDEVGDSGTGKSFLISEDEDRLTKGHKDSRNFRWNKFKWILLLTNLLFTLYSLAALIISLLLWFDVFRFADVVRVGNTTELILSTVVAALSLFTAVVGWAGILLNNRSFLATYTFLLWITFAFLVVPGYVTYKRRTFNLEGKLNLQWSRDLGDAGRLRIQNKLGCCGYYSPFVEATISQTCFSRSVIPGCKASLLDFERRVLDRWYLICFCIVPAHIMIMIASLLCSNHVTYRFGKGMMPKAYRMGTHSMASIIQGYANQLSEQYGQQAASIFVSKTESLITPTPSNPDLRPVLSR